MNRVLEQQVLDLARERGLIGEGDVDASAIADDVVRRWGSRLGVLVTSGALAEADLAVSIELLTDPRVMHYAGGARSAEDLRAESPTPRNRWSGGALCIRYVV